MSAEVQSAVIAGLFAFIVGLIVNIQGKSQFFSTTVSAERMVWIKDIRDLCAALCSICEQYDAETLPPEQYAAFLKARNGILIRLSPTGWYATDDELLELLKEPDFEKVKANLPRVREILMTVLKTEWDKVKIEAGNSRWKVRKIKKKQAQLEKQKHHENPPMHGA